MPIEEVLAKDAAGATRWRARVGRRAHTGADAGTGAAAAVCAAAVGHPSQHSGAGRAAGGGCGRG